MKKITTVLLIAGIGIYFNSCKKAEDKVTPTACFSYSPTDIKTGDEVSFNSDCSQNSTIFSWDFGDGESSTDAAPTHTYTATGDFTVKLTVKDAAGLTNSTSQTITVTQGVTTHSGPLSGDEIWSEGVHEITSSVSVDGHKLTIEPGAIIKFDQYGSLDIGYDGGTAGSTLIANGTADKPIVFTSAASAPTAGDWYSIHFYSGASANCSMVHCIVQYGGGYGDSDGEINIDDSRITLDSTVIEKSLYNGIVLNPKGSFNSFDYDTIRETPVNPIQIYGNNVHTIGANNMISTQTGVLVNGDTYTQADATWNKLTCPYIIDGTLSIENTTLAKLTLAPGVRIEFTQSSELDVGYSSNTFGALVAEGTQNDSIYFTSSAPAGSKTAGDWYSLYFYKGAGNNSSLKYCDIEYGGGYSTDIGEVYVEDASVKIENSTIRNSAAPGISFNSGGKFGSCQNNVITGNAAYPVSIYASNAHTIGTGNTMDAPGIYVNASTVTGNVTWLKQMVPYILDGITYIESTAGNTLTIEPGTVIEFTQSSELDVGYNGAGSLVAQGNASDSITFTSAAPAGNKSPGDWYAIRFYNGTGSGSMLDFCHVAYGGGYDDGEITTDGPIAGRPVISNSTISDSQAYGIYKYSSGTPTLTNDVYYNDTSGNTN